MITFLIVRFYTKVVKKKNKLILKFLFLTNFKPTPASKRFSRYYFCKYFFIFIYFIIFYLNLKLNQTKRLLWKYKSEEWLNYFFISDWYTAYLTLWEIKVLSCENFFFLHLLQTHQKKKIAVPVKFLTIPFLSKKMYITNLNKLNPLFLKIKSNSNSLNNYRFHFIIFTKYFSHFVILRAPFRDKISKNLLSQQRFYVSLTLNIFLNNYLIFFSKYKFLYFLIKFKYLIFFNTNVLFLISKKINFFFFIPSLF